MLRPGGFRTFIVDGLHPGTEAVEALQDRIAEGGLFLEVRSGETYQLPGDEGDRLGLYGFLAVAPEVADGEACALMVEAAEGLQLTWLGLVAAAGDAELRAAQLELAASLDL